MSVAGLAKPEIEVEDGRTIVRAPGFTAEFRSAEVQASRTEVLVRLLATP